MVKFLKAGNYSLAETKKHIKILKLDTLPYKLINAGANQDILSLAKNPNNSYCILSLGKYRLYEVDNEPSLTNYIHLELLVGDGFWQGYLLPHGLPLQKKGTSIFPTNEKITKSID